MVAVIDNKKLQEWSENENIGIPMISGGWIHSIDNPFSNEFKKKYPDLNPMPIKKNENIFDNKHFTMFKETIEELKNKMKKDKNDNGNDNDEKKMEENDGGPIIMPDGEELYDGEKFQGIQNDNTIVINGKSWLSID